MCAGMCDLATKRVQEEDCLSTTVQFILERCTTKDLNQQHYTLNAIEEINCSCSCYRLCSSDEWPSWPIRYGQSCLENICISTWNATYHSSYFNTRPSATRHARSTEISYLIWITEEMFPGYEAEGVKNQVFCMVVPAFNIYNTFVLNATENRPLSSRHNCSKCSKIYLTSSVIALAGKWLIYFPNHLPRLLYFLLGVSH